VLPEVAPKGFEFGGSGYVIISKGNYRPERQSPVKFSFRTFATEGLMMLMGTPGGDFLSIELVDGKVVGKYDLGSGIGTLPAQKRFNDGRWHDLYMNRIGNDGLLKIDNLSGLSLYSPLTFFTINYTVSQKNTALVVGTTLANVQNVHWFSKFFHC